MITQHHEAISNQAECRRALDQLEDLLTFAAIPRALSFELNLAERAALLREAESFFAGGYDKEYPMIAQTLILLVQAIKGVEQPASSP